jgi:hypothetical protein
LRQRKPLANKRLYIPIKRGLKGLEM